MKALFVILAIGLPGCIDDYYPQHLHGDPVPIIHTLDADTYFSRVPGSYATLDDCLANAPAPETCVSELVLCANGSAGVQLGDVVDQGRYTIDNNVAGGSLSTDSFQLDLATGQGSGNLLQGDRPWTIETNPIQVVDCTQPPR